MPTPTEIKKQEDRIQQECVIEYNNTYCRKDHPHRSLIYHVPNQNQFHLVGIGVLAGVSDLIVVHKASPSHMGRHIYIEVKTPTGKQSPAQVDFEQRIRALGYEYYLVRSASEFMAVMQSVHARIVALPF